MTTDVIAAAVVTVTPVSGNWSVAIFYVTLFAWLFFMRLSAADLSDLERMLGEAVIEALERAHIPVKVACAAMTMDESNFRKALRGEPSNHFSLNRLLRLPYSFWLFFLPTLSYIVAKTHITQIVEDAKSMRRSA